MSNYEKGESTQHFPAAFMRHDVEELAAFPQDGALRVSVDLIRRLSPDSLSLMEFKNAIDIRIAEKMTKFPSLGEQIASSWSLLLSQEINMTSDSHLFKTQPGEHLAPLVQGGLFHQFQYDFAPPKYWIKLTDGRKEVLGRQEDEGQKLAYQDYRLAHRRIARNTDHHTLIACVLPPDRFCADTAQTVKNILPRAITVFITAIFNSFVVDSDIRRRVTTHCDMHFMHALRISRLNEQAPAFDPIVERAAKLICTTPEFDDLAQEIGLGSHLNGVTDEAERARLRAELDGIVAHLYGLTEEEFGYILTTFPLVSQEVKDAALAAYCAFAPHPDDRMLAELIAQGESARLEFKTAARWNPHKQAKDDSMKENIVQGVAAFLNSREGGALLIGVNNDGAVIGIEDDYQAVNPQKPGRDSYELFLRNLLSDALSGEHGHSYHISFHHVNGRELCRIAVDPAPKPVYVKGEMYVRTGNQKRKLTAQEAVAYQKQRWP